MKRWGMLLVCLFAVHVAGAQEQNQEEKAKIKEIKLSGNYYFADVTMSKAKDALELALRNLVLTVQSELSVGKEIEPRVKEKWQHIILPRADKQWVFAYIYKGDVDEKFSGQKVTGEKKDTLVVVPVEKDTLRDVPVVKDTVVNVGDVDTTRDTEQVKTVVVPKDSVGSDTVQKVAPPAVKADTSREIQRVTDTVVIVQKDTVVINRRDTVVVREIVKEEKPRTTGNPMLDHILTFKKIDGLQRYFVQKKEEGKLMFGKLSSVVKPEKCYMVIFSRAGDVIAILDKGAGARRNLTKGTDGDHLDNYKGQGKVWFQLY